MAIAALVEVKRKEGGYSFSLLDSMIHYQSHSSRWLCKILVSWLVTCSPLVGFLEFFFTEAPQESVFGHVSDITGTSKNTPWLSGSNLNHYHLGGSLG
ncbi:hypothetical protein IFM89_000033 [Coptis chinensis]|uniref:Uncharacterized protein n=1 Tax=Coptis chinensis TaxID=261450 RepID=A0A835M6C5_9MAGN|nr:hypothetical protein IFM89_000033 [Coptis chinensis]